MLVATILLLFHVLGFLSSINALLTTRTSQGAIAWIVVLNSFPILAVPVYWILGRNKFNGYVTARHAQEEGHDSEIEQIRSKLEPFSTKFNGPGGAGVGTANFDNRSFRLNFEVTALVRDDVFITEVEQMFLHDFKQSKQMNIEGVRSKSLWFRILSRASYLSAPVQ